MELKLFYRTFAVLAFAAAWLCLYPWVYQKVPWLRGLTRSYSPLAWFWQMEEDGDPESASAASASSNSPLDAGPFPPSSADSLFVSGDSIAVLPPGAFSEANQNYQGIEALSVFFKALAEKEQIRIAYYGDSSIEGDLITQTLRDSLQNRFGGAGVGFVSLLPSVKHFRRSVRQDASNNWYQFRTGRKNYKSLPVGIAGQYFTAMSSWEFQASSEPDSAVSGSASAVAPVMESKYWVQFGASPLFDGAQYFPKTRLFYAAPPSAGQEPSAVLGRVHAISEEERHDLPLSAGTGLLSCLALPAEKVSRLRLEFAIPNNLAVYGVSMETEHGVILDNFSLRGNSGAGLLNIRPEMLRQFQEHLDYDLVALQFGLNVLNPKLRDYRWYEDQLIAVIQHFQKALPGVPVLVVGVPDKSTRINGVMRTDPSIPHIHAAQLRAAFRCGAAFFSLYEAMGGEGAMIEWVEQKRLANLDYTHFNFQGADVASNYLLRFFKTGVDQYRKQAQTEARGESLPTNTSDPLRK
ncbi:MAG: hypothetical protein IPH16_09275 [Haliscomenobacter sp.]|nr:hypothetical protein [Haliscomenobacter sp.]